MKTDFLLCMDTECVRWTGGWIAFQKRNKRCWCTVTARCVWKGVCAFDMHRGGLSLCCRGHCKWRTSLGQAAVPFVYPSSSGHSHPSVKPIVHCVNHFVKVKRVCTSDRCHHMHDVFSLQITKLDCRSWKCSFSNLLLLHVKQYVCLVFIEQIMKHAHILHCAKHCAAQIIVHNRIVYIAQ